MDEALIKNWNDLITNEDDVYHLGDFCFGHAGHADLLLKRLNFKTLWYIMGNHDRAMNGLIWKNGNRELVHLGQFHEVRVNGQDITLCHYPLVTWNKKHYGSLMLHGHSHYNLTATRKEGTALGKILDVGVDGNDFKPYSFEEILAIMNNKPIFPENDILNDHHKSNKYDKLYR